MLDLSARRADKAVSRSNALDRTKPLGRTRNGKAVDLGGVEHERRTGHAALAVVGLIGGVRLGLILLVEDDQA